MKRLVLSLVSVAVLVSAVPASAGTIFVDAGWYGFCFAANPGEPATPGCPPGFPQSSGNTFEFVAAGPVLFKITDAFLYGDIFSVVIDGLPAFLTSAPGPGVAPTANPDVAFADANYSKASVLLAAGSHEIDVFYSNGTGVNGAGFLEVESVQAVPDAGSAAALFGLGMIGLSTLRRKLAK